MKNRLLKGTLLLTSAGLITRLIGFGYRIFLSSTLGETRLGIYQLIFPVYSLAFTIYAAGLQTAVSQIISHEPEKKHAEILKGGLSLSLICAVLLSVTLYTQADTISTVFLDVPKTASLLRILSFIFPFCGVTAVINGYFYGISLPKIPAASQIIEQLFRVGFVMLIFFLYTANGMNEAVAVMGILMGELASHIYNMIRLSRKIPLSWIMKSRWHLRHILQVSMPLTFSRLIISLLGSIESILIPTMLIRSGSSDTDALGIYGILTGIVLPFLLFPGTLTNSLSVLLLPAVSRAAGCSENARVKRATAITCRYSLLLGVLTSCLFLNFGTEIGTLLFHNSNAGKLLMVSSFLCPFLYVSTTLSSVINGLGKTTVTFLHNIAGLGIRIFFLFVITPRQGIYGYLFGMMLSQIVICFLDAFYLGRKIGLRFSLTKYFIYPFVFCSGVLYLTKIAGNWLVLASGVKLGVLAFLPVSFIIILVYLLIFKLIRKGDIAC